jgi:hypothetical protein
VGDARREVDDGGPIGPDTDVDNRGVRFNEEGDDGRRREGCLLSFNVPGRR